MGFEGKNYLITGGSGFLGSALVRALVGRGANVRSIDNDSRGSKDRLADLSSEVEFITADIRDADAVKKAAQGIDCVCHLAFINGTEFFYTKPDLVLDVAVRGMINVLDACDQYNVRELVVASSSEVYQTPPQIPTDETAPLSIPDPLNPRYSYAAGKIISEIMAINYARKRLDRMMIFRPHNVYGPDMGWEHVVPQFILRMKELCARHEGTIRFPIQGSGQQTRAFVYIEDLTDGLMKVIESGEHMQIYHIGTAEEMTIANVAKAVGAHFGREIEVVPGNFAKGGASRRCPDISKLKAIGYEPRHSFRDGLRVTARWYDENAQLQPSSPFCSGERGG